MQPILPDSESSSPRLTDANVQKVRASLASVAGREAAYVVYAPGRVNLIGEHTDYNGGFVLPMAIELGIYVAAAPRDDTRVRVWSEGEGGGPAEFDLSLPVTQGEPSWSNYVRGVIRGLLDAGVKLPGFDAVVSASLPAGGGLSSSAALEVAFATLGEVMSGQTLDQVQKALLCQKAEHKYAGTPCGIMDQFAVIFGRRDHLLLIDCQSMERKLVPMGGDEVSLIVINTMVRHELSDGGYRSRRTDCHEGARLLGVRELRDVSSETVVAKRAMLPERVFRRARHVTTENERTLKAVDALQQGRWDELGQLMYASHASLRDDFEVSCEELDVVVDAAQKIGVQGGVYGCRMTGGGFGGCCVVLVRTGQVREVAERLRSEYQQRTKLNPTVFSSRPADGPAVLFTR